MRPRTITFRIAKAVLLVAAIALNACAAIIAKDTVSRVFGVSGALWGLFLLLREVESW